MVKTTTHGLACLVFVIVGSFALPVSAIVPEENTLIKGSGSAVYYLGADGFRYVFPDERIFYTWFTDFNSVVQVTDEELASLPLGGNITHRPGIRMVKFVSDPKVYAVEKGGVLRWVPTEAIAAELYGSEWNKKIDDISDVLFLNYAIEDPVQSVLDYHPDIVAGFTSTINEDLSLPVGTTELQSQTQPDRGDADTLSLVRPFVDVAVFAGLRHAQTKDGTVTNSGQKVSIYGGLDLTALMQQMTGGAAASDYDGDGLVDLYMTRAGAEGILYRNNGDGTFTNRTTSAGLRDVYEISNGAAWGDIDNDGDKDLYVMTTGTSGFSLFMNNGDGTFTDETVMRNASAGSQDIHYGQSVTFGDYDNDGWLDIHTTEWSTIGVVPGTRLLHNKGATAPGFFEDTTLAAGVRTDDPDGDRPVEFISDPVAAKLLYPDEPPAIMYDFASTFTDLDMDGWADLVIVGDYGTSKIFWNNGDGTFTDGTAAAQVGTECCGMGSTFADYDGDGDLDWFVTAIFRIVAPGITSEERDGNRLFENLGGRMFKDVTDEAGVRDGAWGWGTTFFDADNDSDQDLIMTNGWAFDLPMPAMQMRYWENGGEGRFIEAADARGFDSTKNGMGLLSFDYDNDGDIDIFVANNDDTPHLYRNELGNRNDWLKVDVTGTISNRDGLGAKVTVQVTENGPVQYREIGVGSHFLGHGEYTAHFGLGSDSLPVHEVRVLWPVTGNEQVFNDIPRNTTLEVIEE